METTAIAPSKIILFGEHSVVYGYPAIAIPISQVAATATVKDADDGIRLNLPDVDLSFAFNPESDEAHPLLTAVSLALSHLQLDTLPSLDITLTSTIPIASGMGSGAATAAAIIRALLNHLGSRPDDSTVASLTFEVEKRFHGTPGGIDNTVVSYCQPVYFVRRQPDNLVERFDVGNPLQLLIADTGIRSETRSVVSDVRSMWQAQVSRFEGYFQRCGALADAARQVLQRGDVKQLGMMMQENHAVLRAIGVSSAELDALTLAAVRAGAYGAKLSGAGRGGNMIALVSAETQPSVIAALINAGAKSILKTTLA